MRKKEQNKPYKIRLKVKSIQKKGAISDLLECTSDMEPNYTHSQTRNIQKKSTRRIKAFNQNFQYPTTSENTEIQLTHLDQCGPDQTPLPPGTTSRTEIPSFRAESPCTHRALSVYHVTGLKMPDPRFRPLNSTTNLQHIPLLQ